MSGRWIPFHSLPNPSLPSCCKKKILLGRSNSGDKQLSKFFILASEKSLRDFPLSFLLMLTSSCWSEPGGIIQFSKFSFFSCTAPFPLNLSWCLSGKIEGLCQQLADSLDVSRCDRTNCCLIWWWLSWQELSREWLCCPLLLPSCAVPCTCRAAQELLHHTPSPVPCTDRGSAISFRAMLLFSLLQNIGQRLFCVNAEPHLRGTLVFICMVGASSTSSVTS